jgi:hypothetical protein
MPKTKSIRGSKKTPVSKPPQPTPLLSLVQNATIPQVTPKASEDSVRECFIQACENSRAYMDLRFKHFGTFVLISGLLGSVILQAESLSKIRSYLSIISLLITALFWFLDFRTSQYHSEEIHQIQELKKSLSVFISAPPKKVLLIRASTITNLVFLSIFTMWFIIILHFSFSELPIPKGK